MDRRSKVDPSGSPPLQDNVHDPCSRVDSTHPTFTHDRRTTLGVRVLLPLFTPGVLCCRPDTGSLECARRPATRPGGTWTVVGEVGERSPGGGEEAPPPPSWTGVVRESGGSSKEPRGHGGGTPERRGPLGSTGPVTAHRLGLSPFFTNKRRGLTGPTTYHRLTRESRHSSGVTPADADPRPRPHTLHDPRDVTNGHWL